MAQMLNEELQRRAEEELGCILELMEEWALKYEQDYVNAGVIVKQDEIFSHGDVGKYPYLDVHRRRKSASHMPGKA